MGAAAVGLQVRHPRRFHHAQHQRAEVGFKGADDVDEPVMREVGGQLTGNGGVEGIHAAKVAKPIRAVNAGM
jgi:hypothetical protein